MGDDGRKRKRASTPEPESGGTLAPVIEMLDEGCPEIPDQEDTMLSKALADAGKSGTFNVTRWEGILDHSDQQVCEKRETNVN